ncbi:MULTISPECIES: DUF6320 domain-containing protein [unclassified Fusibacter]|uniref:DUF6320 domain-containing protein n=1 Tax=unclassified Fusibacter TaxID=2624464 RepID=UPI0010129802|nr:MULTISPECIES: DUF6320 domain-containing protein [unclassified Fusibacter]MCK8060636.1 DUF6320 domain-containing protein [Fusibacter sp. A2]NPE22910.1 zinc ribbon domain-containing protein [Fusibacter sp. A1]RXV59978.1 zinc ribbon domain-containing protein [Fusibacter sp. A1]
MSRCNQCKLEIKDEVTLCPLCKCVLEKSQDVENMYPDVRLISKRLHLWVRIYAFAAIVAETLLMYLNYKTFEGSLWSVVTGVVLFYVFIVFRLALKDDFEYVTKTIMLILTAILGIILIDVLTGFDGWSLNYFLPGGIILLNTGIVAMMWINWRNWQSYMMIELLAILWSALPFILHNMGYLTNINMSLIACAYSVFLFLGTLIIGGRRALTELKRRFHVR